MAGCVLFSCCVQVILWCSNTDSEACAGRFGGALAAAAQDQKAARMTRGEDPYSQNGLPTYQQRAVRFDGYDDYLVYSQGLVGTHGQQGLDALQSSMTLIVAFRTDGGSGGRDGRGGWILSTNNLFAPPPAGPTGFGLYIDEVGALRPLVGSENRYTSSRKMGAGMHVASLVVSRTEYKLWVNSSLQFNKLSTSDPLNPQTRGPRSASADPFANDHNILNSSLPLTFGVGATAGQLDEYFHGAVAEVLVFKDVLPTFERARVERIMCIRWRDCQPDAGHIQWAKPTAVVGEAGEYYNIELRREGGSDGLIRIGVDQLNGSAIVGQDFYFENQGEVTFEHGDVGPKFISVRILDHYERRMLNKTLSIFIRPICATYQEGLEVTGASFNLTIEVLPTLYWTDFTSKTGKIGGYTGGHNLTFSVVGLVSTSYGCNFVQPIERGECNCAGSSATGAPMRPSDVPSACKQTRSVECVMAESPCKLRTLVHTVDIAGGKVTCQNPLWTCKGHNASMQLLRRGTANYSDRVCARAMPLVDTEPVTRLLQLSAGSMDVIPVHYSWGSNCSIPAWVPIDMQLAVTSHAPNQLNFEIVEPSIENIFPMHGRTVGGDNITLTGHLFGTYDTTPVITIGDTPCIKSTWVSETSVLCSVPRGWGLNRTVKWVADGNEEGVRTTATLRFSYSLPTVTAVNPSLISPHSASSEITIFGANFGTLDFSPAFRLLPTSSTSPVWTSDSQVTVQVSPGLGGVLSIETVVGGVSSVSVQPRCEQLVGFGPTNVTAIESVSQLPTAGGSLLTIYGSDFGAARVSNFSVFVGNTQGLELEWTSDSSCTAKAPAGVGTNVPVFLSLNGMRSASLLTVGYEAHTVTAIDPASLSAANRNSRITIYGTNFGPGLQPAGPYVGACSSSGLEANKGENVSVGDQACANVSYHTTTSLSCVVAPGIGSKDVNLFVNGHSATLVQGFSYDYPRTVSSSPASMDPANTQKFNITIIGKNFGEVDSTPEVRIGFTPCGTTQWFSDTTLVCQAWSENKAMQGVGSVDVRAVVGGQSTPGPLAVKFNFSAPSVSATLPQDAPGLGLTMVTFLGQNFGVADYSPIGMVGKQDCLISKWVSDSSLLCQVPRSPEDNVNGMYKAGVKVAGVASQITKDFRYMIAPQVVSAEPSTGVARGGSRINITGSGFGTSAETVVARINSEDCLETIWESQSSLVCISPAGAGARRSVGVEVTSRTTSIYRTKMNAFAYKPPVAMNVVRNWGSMWNGPTTGAISMTIIGENFGTNVVESQPQAGVGNTLCSSTGWISDSSLGCRMDAGIGGKLDVWVRIACGAYRSSPRYTCRTTYESSSYGTFTYDRPYLQQVEIVGMAGLAAGRGNQTILLKGSNFGTFDAPLRISIGSTNVSHAKWTSDSSITCVAAGGLGTNDIKIVKAVESQLVESVWKNAIEYAAPTIDRISPDFAVSSGGQTVTVIGKHFSPFDHSPLVQLGKTMCAASVWQSDSTVLCKTPGGAYIQRTAKMALHQSYNEEVLDVTKAKAFNFSAGSCAEILNFEPGSPTGEYIINPGGKNFVQDGFVVFCRMGRENVGSGGLGMLSRHPILWLDASDESYLAYEWYDVNASGIPGSEEALAVHIEGTAPKWRERYADSGTYRSPISGWKSRVPPYSTFGQKVKGRRPMFVANTQTSLKSAGNPTGIMDGLRNIHPGVVRFDGFDDFLVSDLVRNTTNSVSVFIAVATQSDSKGGFAVSDNHMDVSPSKTDGYGVFFENDGHVRAIAGSEVRYTSSSVVGTQLQIVSAVADAHSMSLWIDSEIKSGFDKYSCSGGVSDYNTGKPCLGQGDKVSCGRTSSGVTTTNLVMWLDSKQSVSRNGYTAKGTLSSEVKSWASSSSCSGCKRLDATSSASMPLFVDDAVNGLPAIKFSAPSFATVLNSGFQFYSPATVIVVHKSAKCAYSFCESSSGGMFLFGGDAGNGLNGTCFVQSRARVNGQNASLYSGGNGFIVTTLLTSGVSSCTDAYNYLGKSGTGDRWEGSVAELLVWSSELAMAEVYKIEDYLMSKYQIGVPMCVRSGVTNGGGGTEKIHVGTYPAALERVMNAEGGSGFFRGDIAEVVVFDVALSDSERQMVERSMCLRWRDGCASVTVKIELSGLSEELINSVVLAQLTDSIAAAAGVGASNVVILSIVDAPSGGTRRLLQYTSSIVISLSIKFVGLPESFATSLQGDLSSSTTFVNTLVTKLISAGTVPADASASLASDGAPVVGGLVASGFAKWREPSKFVVPEGEYRNGAYRHSVARIPVSRINGTDGAAMVFYNTSDGTALAGRDYVHVQGFLKWNHGDTSDQYIEVEIQDDDMFEDDRSFFINISKSFSEFVGFDVTGERTKRVVIVDNQQSLTTPVYWTGAPSPTRGPLAGGFNVTLTGVNFDTSAHNYRCVWYTGAVNQSCPSAGGAQGHSWVDAVTDRTMCALEFQAADGTVPGAMLLSTSSLVCRAPRWSLGFQHPIFLRLGQGDGPGLSIDRVQGAYAFTFDGPSATNVSPKNVPVIGSATVTITGSEFGFENVTAAIYAEFNGQMAGAQWISDSSVRVLTDTPGTGVNRSISVSIFGASSTLNFMRYDSPVVESLSPPNFFNVSGNTALITVSGKNFGAVGVPAPTASIGGYKCLNVTWVSDSSLLCVSDAQKYARFDDVGRTVNTVVTVDTLSGSRVDSFQFRQLPQIISTTPANGPTVASGVRDITMHGANFGYADNSPTVKIGNEVCNSSRWISDSSIACKVQFVGFYPRDVVLQVPAYGGDGHVTLQNGFTFDAPQIVNLAVSKGPSMGGTRVTVQGFNFGVSKEDYQCVLGGGYAGEATWISDSSVVCTTPHQTRGGPFDVQIKHPSRASNALPRAFNYDAPCASAMVPLAVPKQGARVYISGENFGKVKPDNLFVTIGQTNCSGPFWISDSSLSCVVRPGAQSGHSVLVSRWGSPATPGCTANIVIGYNDLMLRGLAPGNGPVLGGFKITVYGWNFGFTAPSNVKIKVASVECSTSSWISDTSLGCESVPPGEGKQRVVDVQISRAGSGGVSDTVEVGTVASEYFCYDAPRISSVVPDPTFASLATSFNLAGKAASRVHGGANITIIGKNFGLGKGNGTASVLVGSEQCDSSTWFSDSSIRCQTPAYVHAWPTVTQSANCRVNTDLRVISSSLTGTGTGLYSYIHDPVLTALNPTNGPTVATGGITARGICFGNQESSPTLTIGQTSLNNVVWTSDMSIRAELAGGSGGAHNVTVALLNATDRLSSAFSYDSPKVTALTPGIGPTTGNTMLTVFGQNFGAVSGLPLVASVGAKACTVTTWTSDTEITCVLPGCTNSIDLTCETLNVAPSVSTDGVTAKPALVATFPEFSYVVPPIIEKWTAVSPIRGGGGNMTIVGQNFMGPGPRSVTIGGRSCLRTEWSDNAIRCDVPPGRGAYLTISVRVGVGSGHLHRGFSYYPDWISILGPWGEPAVWYSADDLQTIKLSGPYSGRWVESWTSRTGDSQAQLLGSSVSTAPQFKDPGEDNTGAQSIDFTTRDQFLVGKNVRHSDEVTIVLIVRAGAAEGTSAIFTEVNKTDSRLESVYLNVSERAQRTLPDALPVHGLGLFQRNGSHLIMQVGAQRLTGEVPASARNGSLMLVSMLVKAGACELRINGQLASSPVDCQLPASKGQLRLGRGPDMLYFETDQLGEFEIDEASNRLVRTRWLPSFTGEIIEFLEYDGALSASAIERLGRALCLERAMSQCTPLQTKGGVIQWNQLDPVIVKEGMGSVQVSVGRTDGIDGYALVFVRAYTQSACTSLVHMKVPSHCDSNLPSVVDFIVHANNCSECVGCQQGESNGCSFWWEFGFGDDFNRTITLDIPDNLVYQSGNRTLILELYDVSSSYSTQLGSQKTVTLTVQGPDDVQWSQVDKTRVLGSGDMLNFLAPKGFVRIGLSTPYTCVLRSLDPVTKLPASESFRSNVMYNSTPGAFSCATPTEWVSRVKVFYLEVEDASPANEYNRTLLYFSGVNGRDDYIDVLHFWTAISPAVIPAGGVGSNLTITGAGFSASSTYFCQWCLLESCKNESIDTKVQAKVLNTTMITCSPPLWTAGPEYPSAFFRVLYSEVVIHERSSTVPPLNQMCKGDGSEPCANGPQGSADFFFRWAVMDFSPKAVPAAGGVTITLSGMGFLSCLEKYSCHFSNSSFSEKTNATLVDDSTMTCPGPYWEYSVDKAMVSVNCGARTLRGTAGQIPVSFKPISLTSLKDATGLNTLGDSILTIMGQDFGIPMGSSFDNGVEIRVGSTVCATPSWMSETSVKCSVAAGVSTQKIGIDVTVKLAERRATLPVRYAAPDHLSYSVAATPSLIQRIVDAPILTITGSGFGPSNDSAVLVAFVGDTKCKTTSWVADSTVQCRLAEPLICDGPFSNLNVSIRVADTEYFVAPLNSQPLVRPVISRIEGPKQDFQVPTLGAVITITGRDFGVADLKHNVTVGNTACGPVTWHSESSIECAVKPGTGHSNMVTIHALGCDFPDVGSRFEYSSPVVDSITPNRLPIIGGGVITLSGSGFGVTDKSTIFVNLSGVACINVTWTSDSRISCFATTDKSYETLFNLTVMVDGVLGTAKVFLSFFNNPRLFGVSRGVVEIVNTTVVLSGLGFGTTESIANDPLPPVAFFGGSVSASTAWHNDTAIIALVPPGFGKDLHNIELKVRDFTATLVSAWKYAAPSVNILTHTPGNDTLAISGSNYGTYDSTPKVRVGGSACAASRWTSDSSVECKLAAGTGSQYDVRVTVGQQEGSKPNSFAFNTPLVSSISTTRGQSSDGTTYVALAGDTVISVFGSGFGLGNTAVRMAIAKAPYNGSDSSPCEPATWFSDSSLSCRTHRLFNNARYGLSLTFGRGNNTVSVKAEDAPILQFAASSPTCESLADGLAASGTTAEPGYYNLDPTFQSNSDAVPAYCGLRTEKEDIAVIRLGTNRTFFPPFLWLDPVAEETISLDCESTRSVDWNSSFHAIDHAPCTHIKEWSSRQKSRDSMKLSQEDVFVRPIYRREDGEPARVEFNGLNTFLTASKLRSGSILTAIVVAKVSSTDQGGWIIGDNDLYATPVNGVGLQASAGGLFRPTVGPESFLSLNNFKQDEFHVVTLVGYKDAFEMYVDGSLADGVSKARELEILGADAQTSRGVNVQAGTAHLTLGKRATLGGLKPFFKGQLGDVVMFNRTLTRQEQQNVERALCIKWNVSACAQDVSAGTIVWAMPSFVVQESFQYAVIGVNRTEQFDGYLEVKYECNAHGSSHRLQNTGNLNESWGSWTPAQQKAALTKKTASFAATEGTDFIAVSGVMSWGHMEQGMKMFTVPLVDNELLQEPRSFECSVRVEEKTPIANITLPSPVDVVVQDPYCSSDSARENLCVPYRPTYWKNIDASTGMVGGGYAVTLKGAGFDANVVLMPKLNLMQNATVTLSHVYVNGTYQNRTWSQANNQTVVGNPPCCKDSNRTILDMLTDGKHEGSIFSPDCCPTCNDNVHIQVDLGKEFLIYEISRWDGSPGSSYCNQKAQLSLTAQFSDQVTVFSCGTYSECGTESPGGKTIGIDPPVRARYLRYFSSRSQEYASVFFTEIKVVGTHVPPTYDSPYSCAWYTGTWVNHPPASFSGLVEYSRGESIRLGRGDRLNGTEIVCYTPTWRHKSLQVNLKVFEGGIGIEHAGHGATFLFTRPSVTGSAPNHVKAGAGGPITIFGRGFGKNNSNPTVHIGETEYPGAFWLSETSIRVQSSGGTGLNPVCVAIGEVEGCSVLLVLTIPSLDLNAWTSNPEYELEIRQAIASRVGASINDVTVVVTNASDAGSTRRLLSTGLQIQVLVTMGSMYDAAEALTSGKQISSVSLGGTTFSVTAAVQYAATFSYDPPNVTALLPHRHPPAVSGDKHILTIIGENFGPNDKTPKVGIGDTACHASVWTSDSSVSCVTPAGKGQQPVKMEVSGFQSVSTIKYAFRPQPNIAYLQPNNAPVMGAQNITFVGSDFGHADHTPLLTIGSTACESSNWVSDSLVVCKSPYGWGEGFDAKVQISLEMQTLNNVYTYDALVITAVRPMNGPPASSAFVTVFGANLGKSNETMKTKCEFGDTAGPLVWVSDSSAVCTVGPQRAYADALSVFVGSRAGDIRGDSGYHFDAPWITYVSGRTSPTTGGGLFSIMGQNFGDIMAADMRASIGRTVCSDIDWKSDTAMACKVPPGTSPGAVHVVVTRWGIQSPGNSSQTSVSYGGPTILQVPLVGGNGPATGGTMVTVLGAGFGPTPDEEQKMVNGGTVTVCTGWISDTSMACTVAPGHSTNNINVLVNGIESNVVNVTFSYDRPMIFYVDPENGPPGGMQYLTITGRNFGSVPPPKIQGYIGSRLKCLSPKNQGIVEEVDWISDSSLLCGVPPGSGRKLAIKIEFRGENAELKNAFDYFPSPVLLSAPQTGLFPSQIGGPLSIFGVRFGVRNQTTGRLENPGAVAYVGDSECVETKWNSDSSIVCQVGPGAGLGLDVRVRVYQGYGTLMSSFSYYPPPQVTAVEPKNEIISGGNLVTIFGHRFERSDYNPTAKIGNKDCTRTQWVSENIVLCDAPSSVELRDDLPVSVTVRNQTGTLLKAIDYSGGGVVNRLGMAYPLPIIWMDPSKAYDFEADGPVRSVKYVREWSPQFQPPKLQGQDNFVFKQSDQNKRPQLVDGFLRFDGIDDSMIANRVLMRPQNEMTLFIAVRPAKSFRDSRGVCVARPVIYISDNGKELWIQSPDDGLFVKPTPANLNPRFRVYTGDDEEAKTLTYESLEFKPAGGSPHLPDRYILKAPPGISYPKNGDSYFLAVPYGMSRPCAPGWVFSDNEITAGGSGIGIYLDEDNLVRPVAGTDTTAVSQEQFSAGWQILSLQISANFYRLYIDGNIEAGFEMTKSSADAPWWQLADVSQPTLNMVLGSRSTGMSPSGRGHFHGDIGEMVIYKQVLSDENRIKVNRALCARWKKNKCDPTAFAGRFLFSWKGLDRLPIAQGVSTPVGVITRTGGSDGYVRIRYRAANSTAKNGFDFLGVEGTVDWAHGDATDRFIDPAPALLINREEFYGNAPAGIRLPNRSFFIVLEADQSEVPIEPMTTTIPIMNDVPGVSRAVPSTGFTRGGEKITIEGYNFGDSDAHGMVYPPRAPQKIVVSIGATECATSTWLSMSSIRCITPRGGTRDAAARSVSVDTTVACPSHATWSGCLRNIHGQSPDIYDYNPPTINVVKPRDDIAAVGVATVTLIGASFGYSDPSAAVSVGDSKCQFNNWVSDSTIKCKLPLGSGRDKQVKVIMPGGAAGTLVAGFSFRPALEPTGIHPSNTPAKGAGVLQVRGHNFGVQDNTVTIRLGDTQCSSSQWISQTVLKCTVAPVCVLCVLLSCRVVLAFCSLSCRTSRALQCTASRQT
jgi:hypothetical protein